ncbi:MAG TPA: hypothetical protein VKR58_05720 [Aquella sp.]|nr:hypothetical protein [Aquella sp.]
MTKIRGKRFGKLVATGKSEVRHANPNNPKSHSQYVEVECDCGTVKWVNKPNLMKGEFKSCGCGLLENRYKYISTAPENISLYHIWILLKKKSYEVCKEWLEDWDTFAEWAFSNGYEKEKVLARKDITLPLDSNNAIYLTREDYYDSIRKEVPVKEPKPPTLRMQYPDLATKLNSMKIRCNPNYNDPNRSKAYAAKGITICEEWLDINNFITWALENGYEKGLTIERKDNDLGYYPDNCKFIPKSEQAWNIYTNNNITGFGETKPLSVWGRDKRIGYSSASIAKYIKMGMSLEDIAKKYSEKFLKDTV